MLFRTKASERERLPPSRARAIIASHSFLHDTTAGQPAGGRGTQPKTRRQERYGDHRFGQNLLLARRLAEAGVPMIAIHFNHMTRCDGWDTHAKNFEACQNELLPMLDQGLSALLDDLVERGLLDETVVACFGEFGRTPRVNAAAGRDHWGPCSSALLAGGGIQVGRVIGESDRDGAYPRSGKVDPVDLHASIFHCLGINPRCEVRDESGRPLVISNGQPIAELF